MGSKRGEIATIVTVGTLLVLGVTTLVSSLLLNKTKQITKTKAAEIENQSCGTEGAWNSICVDPRQACAGGGVAKAYRCDSGTWKFQYPECKPECNPGSIGSAGDPNPACIGKAGGTITNSCIRKDCDPNINERVCIEEYCDAQGQLQTKPGSRTGEACGTSGGSTGGSTEGNGGSTNPQCGASCIYSEQQGNQTVCYSGVCTSSDCGLNKNCAYKAECGTGQVVQCPGNKAPTLPPPFTPTPTRRPPTPTLQQWPYGQSPGEPTIAAKPRSDCTYYGSECDTVRLEYNGTCVNGWHCPAVGTTPPPTPTPIFNNGNENKREVKYYQNVCTVTRYSAPWDVVGTRVQGMQYAKITYDGNGLPLDRKCKLYSDNNTDYTGNCADNVYPYTTSYTRATCLTDDIPQYLAPTPASPVGKQPVGGRCLVNDGCESGYCNSGTCANQPTPVPVTSCNIGGYATQKDTGRCIDERTFGYCGDNRQVTTVACREGMICDSYANKCIDIPEPKQSTVYVTNGTGRTVRVNHIGVKSCLGSDCTVDSGVILGPGDATNVDISKFCVKGLSLTGMNLSFQNAGISGTGEYQYWMYFSGTCGGSVSIQLK